MSKQTIFFSYSRVDSGFVLQLAKDLRDAGAEIWLDQLDIKPGTHWDSAIENALSDSSRLIVVLSPTSVASNNVMDEVNYALENNKSVIPVLLNECTVPFRLRRVQRVNFSQDYQTALDQLLEVLGHGHSSRAAAAKASTETATPVAAPTADPDNALWEKAKKENSVSSYKKYLQETTSDTHKQTAQQHIDTLTASQKDREFEELFWKKTKAENTPAAYALYLKEYPHGIYRMEALMAGKETEALPGKSPKKKYIFIGAGVFVLAILLWLIIGGSGGHASDQNKNKQASAYVGAEKYDSAWLVYNSMQETEMDTTAFVNMGDMYLNAWGTAKDSLRAKSYYEKAATAGSSIGMNKLGDAYYNAAAYELNYGSFLDAPFIYGDTATTWYKKAIAAGSIGEGNKNMGYLLYLLKKYEDSKKYFITAGDAGDLNACEYLGDLYKEGNEKEGTVRNLEEAKKWYSRACNDEKGLEEACTKLKALTENE